MIGDLQHRLILQACSRARDGAGGFNETWADVTGDAVVYAAIAAVGGGAQMDAGGLRPSATYRLKTRYRDDMAAGMRLFDGNGYYEIVSALDRDGRRQYLEVLATRAG